MPQILASTLRNVPYCGEEGNRSGDHGFHTLVAPAGAIGDTIDLLTIPAGSKLLGVSLVNAVLGLGTTISLGFRNKDGTVNALAGAAVLLPATATAAAAKTLSVFAPISFTTDAVLFATVGGAVALGKIDVITDYLFVGTL
jgi:hypothetical protein